MRATAKALRSFSIGCRGISQTIRMGSAGSTERPCTSMTTPCKAVTRIGIPSFTTMGGPRSRTSCWRAVCFGSTAIESTGCVWMRWLPCSTLITADPRAVGSRTSTAGAKISRLSRSFADSIRRYSHASPRRRRRPRNRRLGRWCRGRSIGEGLASGTSGTWGGCTTHSITSARTRFIAATITVKSCSVCTMHSSRISFCRCPMTRSYTVSVQSSDACREMTGNVSPICGPITALCSGILARSSCSWEMSSRRKTSGATTIHSTGIWSTELVTRGSTP